MTFWYDHDDEVLIGNNLGEFVEIDDNGEVRIDVAGIMDRGRGTDKLKEIVSQTVTAIIDQA